ELVGQREEELGLPGVALPPGAAAQLVIDAPTLVPLGAEHVKPAGRERLFLEPRDLLADLRRLAAVLAAFLADILEFLANAHVGIAAKLNIGAAPGHIRGNRDRAGHSRLGDDIRLLFVVTRVDDVEYLGLGRSALRRKARCEGIRVGEVMLLPAALA